jgi:hypothetical protein
MLLTIGYGFPFGLIFLLALLGMVAVRAPYAHGWLGQAAAEPATQAADPEPDPPDTAPAEPAEAVAIAVAPNAVEDPFDVLTPAQPIAAEAPIILSEPVAPDGQVAEPAPMAAKPKAAPRRRPKRQAAPIIGADAAPDNRDGASPA